MQRNLYTIFDLVAVEAGPIFHAKNDAVAMRMYDALMAEKKLDYDEQHLYYVGKFDDESLQFYETTSSRVIANVDMEDPNEI